VTGEAEDTFARVTSALVEERSPAGIPGVAQRGPLGFTAFAPQPAANFPLTDYPSPYSRTWSRWIRGARPTWRRSAAAAPLHVLLLPPVFERPSPAGRGKERCADRGASRSRRARGRLPRSDVQSPAGVRPAARCADPRERRPRAHFLRRDPAEGLTALQARKLKKAGFDRLEIGLRRQPRDVETRAASGSPEKVAEAARMLHGEGIELLVDLIVGLPATRRGRPARDRVSRGERLAGEAQVFPLSLLRERPCAPRLAGRRRLRSRAALPRPPHRDVSEEALLETLLAARIAWAAASMSGPAPPRRWRARRIRPTGAFRAARCALVPDGRSVHAPGRNPAGDRRALRLDPYATLDVVICPDAPFPLDLLDLIRGRLRDAPEVTSRVFLGHRGEDLQRRIAVVLRGPQPRIGSKRRGRERRSFASRARARRCARRKIGHGATGARITGPVTADDFSALARLAEGESVVVCGRGAGAPVDAARARIRRRSLVAAAKALGDEIYRLQNRRRGARGRQARSIRTSPRRRSGAGDPSGSPSTHTTSTVQTPRSDGQEQLQLEAVSGIGGSSA